MILSWIVSIIGIVIVFSIIVLIHELGHFLMCRKYGIKVLEFGFGIPPRLWGKKIGETIYSINWFPIGGFVQPLGEDDVDPKALKDPRSFAVQNVWKRIAVVVAGVVMNILLAFFAYYLFLAITGFKTQLPLIIPHHFVGVEQTDRNLDIITNVTKGSLADKEGWQAGWSITAVNSQPVNGLDDLSQKILLNAGQTVTLTVAKPPYDIDWKQISFTMPKEVTVGIDQVVVNSPADKAGLHPGDIIESFNNQPLKSLDDFVQQTKAVEGKQITLTITDQNAKNEHQITVTPRLNPPVNEGALGISLHEIIIPDVQMTETPIAVLSYQTWWQKLLAGPIHSYNIVDYSIQVMGKFISTAIAQKNPQVASYAVGGPIAIGVVSHQIFEQSDWFAEILNLIGGISLSLGLVNVLPIPALDGGRLFFLLIEGIFRKKINPNLERKIHTVGMIALLSLSVLIAFSDVNNYVIGH